MCAHFIDTLMDLSVVDNVWHRIWTYKLSPSLDLIYGRCYLPVHMEREREGGRNGRIFRDSAHSFDECLDSIYFDFIL